MMPPPPDLYERLLKRLVTTWDADTDSDFLDAVQNARTALNGSSDAPIFFLSSTDATALDTLAVHRQLLIYAGSPADHVDRALVSFRRLGGSNGNGHARSD